MILLLFVGSLYAKLPLKNLNKAESTCTRLCKFLFITLLARVLSATHTFLKFSEVPSGGYVYTKIARFNINSRAMNRCLFGVVITCAA
jgi:hypothetical protein